jgi:hypothetical protein
VYYQESLERSFFRLRELSSLHRPQRSRHAIYRFSKWNFLEVSIQIYYVTMSTARMAFINSKLIIQIHACVCVIVKWTFHRLCVPINF